MTTEDHQPNELFKHPKGRAIIPSIRSSQSPKWQTAFRGIRGRGRGALKHAQWDRQAYTQSERVQSNSSTRSTSYSLSNSTRESTLPYTQQSAGRSNNFPTSIHAHPSRARNVHTASMVTPPSPVISSTAGAIQGSYNIPERTYVHRGPSKLAPAPSENGGSSNTVKRRTREWESKESGSIKKKKRKEKSNPIIRNMELVLPEGCRKGAPSRSHSKSLFLADIRDGMRHTVGAEILSHKYTDTHLIISYHPPDTQNATQPSDTPSNSGTPATNASNSDLQPQNIYEDPRSLYNAKMMGATSSWRGNDDFPNFMDRSSGSNVKLEDLYSTSHGPNTARTGISDPSMRDLSLNEVYKNKNEALSVSNMDLGDLCKSIHAPVAPENGYSGSATFLGQSFSPEVVTSHPQVEVARGTPRQISKRPRRFRSGTVILSYGPPLSPVPTASSSQEHNSTFSEVIEIEDTPPPSPRMKISRSDENNATGCRAPSPSVTDEHMEEETKPEPESLAEVFLEEETSTVTHLPRASGDKPRRLLISYSQDRIYSASMHGSIQEVVRKTRR